MKETFVDIKGFEGLYQISNFGRVKSILFNREKIIKSFIGTGGYVHLNLRKNGILKNLSIHRLVAIHFINNTSHKPDVNHIDGNKNNNSVQNLEWCTKSENINHSFFIGTHPRKIGELNSNAKLKECDVIQIQKEYSEKKISLKALGIKYGVGKSSIFRIVKGISWPHVTLKTA